MILNTLIILNILSKIFEIKMLLYRNENLVKFIMIIINNNIFLCMKKIILLNYLCFF